MTITLIKLLPPLLSLIFLFDFLYGEVLREKIPLQKAISVSTYATKHKENAVKVIIFSISIFLTAVIYNYELFDGISISLILSFISHLALFLLGWALLFNNWTLHNIFFGLHYVFYIVACLSIARDLLILEQNLFAVVFLFSTIISSILTWVLRFSNRKDSVIYEIPYFSHVMFVAGCVMYIVLWF